MTFFAVLMENPQGKPQMTMVDIFRIQIALAEQMAVNAIC